MSPKWQQVFFAPTWVGGFSFLFFPSILSSQGMKQRHSWWGESHKQPRTLHASVRAGEIVPSVEGSLVQRLIFKPLLAEGHQDTWKNAKSAAGKCAEDLWAFWTGSWWDACRWEWARKGQGLLLIGKCLSRGWEDGCFAFLKTSWGVIKDNDSAFATIKLIRQIWVGFASHSSLGRMGVAAYHQRLLITQCFPEKWGRNQ